MDIRFRTRSLVLESLLTRPMSKSSLSSSFAYLRSNSRSFAKSSTEVLTLPALRKVALYPNVRILARQIPGSSGRNVRGQNNSGFLYLDHVNRLVPPRPWMKTMSALWPFSGVYTTFRPSGPASSDLLAPRE